MRVLALTLVALLACSDDQPTMSVEQLQDPDSCMECHPKHYQDWAASMHAYASDDPVFVAMNKRGQRETNNELGTFCVQCHAPMAVALETTNGIDFDPATLPKSQKGVTCYFCHNVKSVESTHNNGLVIALDQTMRGGVRDPVASSAHNVKYDPLMDGTTNDSSMCGSCHDVVTPKGIHLETTFEEWQTTIFASEVPAQHLTCGTCHMRQSTDVIADDPNANVPLRKQGFHRHTFAAIDQATTPWPDPALLATHIQDDLYGTLQIVSPRKTKLGGICVPPSGPFTVRIDNTQAGHSFPSGATHDRRVWLEIKAYDAANALVFTSGVVADGMDPPDITTPNFTGFWDVTWKDAAKTERAHFFWDVAAIDSKLNRPALVRPPITLDPNSASFDHSTTTEFNVPGGTGVFDRIEAVVRVRAFPLEMLDLLISSGDLDPSIRSKLPTLDIEATRTVWLRATSDGNSGCNPLP